MSDELTAAIAFLEQELGAIESKAEALRSAIRILRAKENAEWNKPDPEFSTVEEPAPDEDEQIESAAS